jgi:hypothetical protein
LLGEGADVEHRSAAVVKLHQELIETDGASLALDPHIVCRPPITSLCSGKGPAFQLSMNTGSPSRPSSVTTSMPWVIASSWAALGPVHATPLDRWGSMRARMAFGDEAPDHDASTLPSVSSSRLYGMPPP